MQRWLQLGTMDLESVINKSNIVVSKTGYTTIMDLVPYQKPMILVPTEGQYEQQYLSTLHHNRNVSSGHEQSAVFELYNFLLPLK